MAERARPSTLRGKKKKKKRAPPRQRLNGLPDLAAFVGGPRPGIKYGAASLSKPYGGRRQRRRAYTTAGKTATAGEAGFAPDGNVPSWPAFGKRKQQHVSVSASGKKNVREQRG